ncbi:30S ribosomal protein S13 [Candidatus Kaiserbacteria bacterium CG10_big_fil_rev_8_21_14_0_10_45_20]|uniref:Small ribosomal subunit protein uS13 n=1 Tax=Candidatus Kaiserbacteria bacterium CG10_big_fil_rev_8_21_14_0_10_45_20 TaxID=1974607 RepID=A0A2H0UGJ5_9BACT|nr:MAG: 30S ribosomal protein S13 [Candidatus Kaiserbacteria bacterium CG10_big_fil_rev_8_21_14_0_10_45_20]
MRIAGITIEDNKQLAFSLTAVYGVGQVRARTILREVGVPEDKKAKDLNADEELKIRTAVEGHLIEGDLRREVAGNIKRLKDIKANRGIRHARGMPTRGQRTKTNSRTVRGNVRRTMSSGRRKLEKT